jgi:hypothetical protein
MILLPALVALSCNTQVMAPPIDGPQVLFIGNSLTYTNDLPGMLAAMIDSAGAEPTFFESRTLPNFGLEDHWQTGAREAIASRAWDIVVLQQGPSATEGRPSLLEFSARFNDDVRKGGGRVALYMVWPAAVRDFDFDGVSESYRLAAEQVDGLLFPAGEAWRAAWRIDSTLTLYGDDGFHPSILGTYVAALVMFEQLTGLPVERASASFQTPAGLLVSIPDETAEILKAAATEANEEFGR